MAAGDLAGRFHRPTFNLVTSDLALDARVAQLLVIWMGVGD